MKKVYLLLLFLFFATNSKAGGFSQIISYYNSAVAATNTISLIEVVGAAETNYGEVTLTPSAAPSSGEFLLILASDDLPGETAVPPDGSWTAMDRPDPNPDGIVTEGTTNSVYAYYKVAGASEPSSYTWGADGANRAVAAVLIRLSKTGGTWSVVDNNTSTNATDASVTTGSVTVGTGQFLITFWGGDDSTTVSTPPADMTERYIYSTSVSAACYTQADASGATTKTLVWSAGTQTCTWAIVVGLI